MAQVLLKVGYRPMRIGWCLKKGDMTAFRKVIHLTHSMWGGVFNPIIPIDDKDLALRLISLYRVDGLFPATDDVEVIEFAKENNKPKWPIFWDELFIDKERLPTVLDIRHSLLHLSELHALEMAQHGHSTITIPQWRCDDPLADVFACRFGVIPDSSIAESRDYRELYASLLAPRSAEIANDEEIAHELAFAQTPSHVCQFNLQPDYRYNFNSDWRRGVFIGHCDNFDDLVAYWNLLATDADAVFFDERHEKRLFSYCRRFLEKSVGGPAKLECQVWKVQDILQSTLEKLLENITPWNYGNPIFSKSLHPPRMIFDEQRILANTDENDLHALNFTLPPPPFHTNLRESHTQHAVVTVSGASDISRNSDLTLFAPCFQELNEFVGRNSSSRYWKSCRIQHHGFDFIEKITDDLLYLRPLLKQDVIARTLEIFGIKAQISKPGHIAHRLIKQMGGTQGCRVLKIAGVRALISKFGITQSFVRVHALQIIGQKFDKFEDLFIGQGRSKLTPEFVFDQLVELGIFRVGLDFLCPTCNLDFWIPLDSVQTVILCDFCGEKFNITRQLRKKDWKYRISGLFSAHRDQQGSIPVAVTLQQLDTIFAMDRDAVVFHTAMEFESTANQFQKCESDLVILGRNHRDKPFLVIGECKNQGAITDEDVDKLKSVADSLPLDRITPFILFSKLSAFTDEEITRCRRAQSADRLRVILLSDKELEPYDVYENAPPETGVSPLTLGLQEMCAATAVLHFKEVNNVRELWYHGPDEIPRLPTRKLPEQTV